MSAAVARLPSWPRGHPGAVTMAGLLAFAGPLTFFTGALGMAASADWLDLARLASWWTLYAMSLWIALIAGGFACESLAPRFDRFPPTMLWLFAAALAAAAPNLLTAGRAALLMQLGLVHSPATMHLHGFIVSLVMALLYFAHLRRSREHEQAAARLAAAQAAQRHSRRRVAEAQLLEVQARIDPELLFRMLDAVRRLYERDTTRAEQFLDELIAFLRAALPRYRAESSSLPREAELARAFVRLHAGATGRDLDLRLDIAPQAMHARFPPGVLLPLLDTAVASDAGACRLIATCTENSCRVVLALGASPAQRSLALVQALLSELYGPAATLQMHATEGGVHLIVEVPYELA